MSTTYNLEELWGKCLADIELEVSKPNFSTWFKNTCIVKEDSGTICVGVPNEFVRDWLSNKYHKMILKVLMTYTETVRGVEYLISKPESKNNQSQDRQNVMIVNKELPLKDLYINKDDNLNPRYTFDTFIVGPFNELAYAAGKSIIDRPGFSYNPLFIYGSTGLGKTHLIQSIGNAIKTKFQDKKVYYTTLEKFATDLVQAFQNNKANSFKDKYRKYDVLIMDDIQFIGKMEKTQEELFHTFNTMYENNKQIIFSSDKHPNYIPGLEDRLRSRFSQGMIVDIIEPDFESRVAILKAKAREVGYIVPDEVLQYIAEVVSGNIRELEGSLNSIICQSQIRNKTLSITEVKNVLKNSVKPKKNISIKEVVKIVADFYNIEENTIYDKTRRKEIVQARQMIMYILREEFSVSYPLIGQKLGGKDHTTVIHSYEKVKNDLKTNSVLAEELDQLKAMFK
jgi:chromosomal replication initiator protein